MSLRIAGPPAVLSLKCDPTILDGPSSGVHAHLATSEIFLLIFYWFPANFRQISVIFCYCVLISCYFLYHPPENFHSQDKMFLGFIPLCKCNFSSFHNYFFMQVQVGALPELVIKQVVMQVPFSSIPGFWGTLLGLRHCREDSVGIFALENQSHRVGAI